MSILAKITKGQIGRAQRTVIYAPEGFGKSTLASLFPDPLFADVEESTSQLDVARLSRNELPNLKTFEALCGEVAKTRPCKTFVVDTIDWLEEMAIYSVIEEDDKKWQAKNIEEVGGGYGKGYNFLATRLSLTLSKLDAIIAAGIHVVLLAHASIVRFDPPDGVGAFDRYELKLHKDRKGGKGTASLIKEWADMILFGNYRLQIAEKDKGKLKGVGGRERQMHCNRSAAWDAKNRHGMADVEKWDIGVIEAAFRKVNAPWGNVAAGATASTTAVQNSASIKNLEAGQAATAATGASSAESDAASSKGETAPPPALSDAEAFAMNAERSAADEIPMRHDATGQAVTVEVEAVVTKLDDSDPFVKVCGANEAIVNALLLDRKEIKPGQTWRDASESYRARVRKNPAGFEGQAKLLASKGGAK